MSKPNEKRRLVGVIEELLIAIQSMHSTYMNDRDPNRAETMNKLYVDASVTARFTLNRYPPGYGKTQNP